MRRGETEAGGEGTGMSPRSARAAGALGGGSPAERGPGRLPGAGREGGDARGREKRDTREVVITHSVTHSHGRAASPPPLPATSRREEPPAPGATAPAGPPGRGGDPRAPAHPSQGHPTARGVGREGGGNLVFDGGHGKGGRGAAPRRGEGDGKGELHHGPGGAPPRARGFSALPLLLCCPSPSSAGRGAQSGRASLTPPDRENGAGTGWGYLRPRCRAPYPAAAASPRWSQAGPLRAAAAPGSERRCRRRRRSQSPPAPSPSAARPGPPAGFKMAPTRLRLLQ